MDIIKTDEYISLSERKTNDLDLNYATVNDIKSYIKKNKDSKGKV